jgi:TRAP-type mannitol/chloroaromatic compound transport system substrate-binding protein
MKRRTFIAGLGTGSVAAAAFPKPALSQGIRRLRVLSSWKPATRGYSTSLRRLVSRIATATGGEIQLTISWADEPVAAFDTYDVVSRGEADMYFASEQYWYARKSPGYAFFGSLPFGMTASEHEAWMEHMGGNALWQELAARFNIMPLPCGDTGVQMAGFFTREVHSTSDFRGLRYRVPGIYAPIIEQLGAIPVSLPGNKIADAFRNGELDAAEFVGPWPDRELGMHETAKFYYWPGIHSPVSLVGLGINLQVWNSFSATQKAIFHHVCRQERRDMLQDFYSYHGLVLQEMVRDGTQLRQFPDTLLADIGRAAGPVIAEKMQGDELLSRIYISFMSARTQLLRWNAYSEESFLIARRLPFRYGPMGQVDLVSPDPMNPAYLPEGDEDTMPEPEPQPTILNTISRI